MPIKIYSDLPLIKKFKTLEIGDYFCIPSCILDETLETYYSYSFYQKIKDNQGFDLKRKKIELFKLEQNIIPLNAEIKFKSKNFSYNILDTI